MKKEKLTIGDIIIVRYGGSLEIARIIYIKDGDILFNLTGFYSGCRGRLEGREWYFIRHSYLNIIKNLFI